MRARCTVGLTAVILPSAPPSASASPGIPPCPHASVTPALEPSPTPHLTSGGTWGDVSQVMNQRPNTAGGGKGGRFRQAPCASQAAGEMWRWPNTPFPFPPPNKNTPPRIQMTRPNRSVCILPLGLSRFCGPTVGQAYWEDEVHRQHPHLPSADAPILLNLPAARPASHRSRTTAGSRCSCTACGSATVVRRGKVAGNEWRIMVEKMK
jgi:hypothetical protein